MDVPAFLDGKFRRQVDRNRRIRLAFKDSGNHTRAMAASGPLYCLEENLPDAYPLTIASVAVDVYRSPIRRPIRTSFGTMTDRPAVIVTASSPDGYSGYGEVWCNFPAPAAEYRARLISSVLGPAITGRTWSGPREVFDHLSRQTRVLAIQAGEPGPFSQAIAGMDIALWDMVARRAGIPLWRLLGGEGSRRIPAYASGIGPDEAVGQVLQARSDGHQAFKLKVGFDPATDLANLRRLRRELGYGTVLAVDANQAWSPGGAARRSRELAGLRPAWLEEPIRADRPAGDWQRVAAASSIPLAAGENVYGIEGFTHAIRHLPLGVLQPDLTKWGGFSGCLPLARLILETGRRFCPHYLGGGIGLLASAHLLAAVGGDGMLEVDCNPNPLREGLARPFPRLVDGHLTITDQPGLGVQPDDSLRNLRTRW